MNKQLDSVINIFGLMRSGHHAIIGWISAMFPKPVFFFHMMKAGGIKENIRSKNFTLNSYDATNYKKIHGLYTKQNKINCVMFNYEDRCIKNTNINLVYKFLKTTPKKIYNVIILRDFFNNLSSRVKYFSKKLYGRNCYESDFPNLWVSYAEEFLNNTKYLTNKVSINYNRWHTDLSYRQHLAKQLNLKFNDRGKKWIPPHGGGSSFNDKDVLNRWQKFKQDPFFNYVVNYIPKAKNLSEEIFNERI